MARNALTEVRVNVTPYAREGHAVRGHKASRLKDLGIKDVGQKDKVSVDDFNSEYDKISEQIFDKQGNFQRGTSLVDLEAHTKKLYSLSSESGVDPSIFNSEKFLDNVYRAYSEELPNDVFQYVGTSGFQVFGDLLDRGNIDTVIKSTDGLESKFKNDFGIETERIDPFTFKFKQKGYINDSIREKNIEYIDKKVKGLREKHGVNLDIHSGLANDDIESAFRRSDKQFLRGGGLAALTSHIVGLPGENLSTHDINKLDDFILENSSRNETNPDKIKKLLSKDLRSSGIELESMDKVTGFFEGLDGKYAQAAFLSVLDKGKIPTYMKDNPELMKDLNSIVSGVSQIQSIGKSSAQGADLYVSRNPLNMLTMAPTETCPSCQSITRFDEVYKKENIDVGKDNINVAASHNMHTTNDFIMYTLGEKSGQKNARISLTYDPKSKTYVNYEEGSIYGVDAVGKEVIQGFIDSHKDKFVEAEYKEPIMPAEMKQESNTQSQLDKINLALDRVYEDFDRAIENGDVGAAEEAASIMSDSHNKYNQNKQSIVSGIKDDFDEMYVDVVDRDKSLLYGSPGANFVYGSREAFKMAVTDVEKLGKYYKSSTEEMQQKLATLSPPKKSAA